MVARGVCVVAPGGVVAPGEGSIPTGMHSFFFSVLPN